MNRTANASIYHVYKYFEKGNGKNKYRRPPKGLLRRPVRVVTVNVRIVAEKSEISGAAFSSPPKRCKVKENYNTG